MLLKAFLFAVEGLIFLTFGTETGDEVFSLVSRENENVSPIFKVNAKALPWLASVWQKTIHWDAMEDSATITGADIVNFFLKFSKYYFLVWHSQISCRRWVTILLNQYNTSKSNHYNILKIGCFIVVY